MIVELETIVFTQVARLVDAQDDGFQKAIEATEDLRRRHLLEIPWSNSVFDWFEQGVLANTLRAT